MLATEGEERFGGLASHRVERFVEKPARERALELLETGRASWNGGIFVWRRDALVAGLARFAPDIADAVSVAVAGGPAAIEAAYPQVRSTSIDYALLEPASVMGQVAVIPMAVGWSDLGSWDALLRASHDPDGVAVRSEAGSGVMEVGADRVLIHAAGGRLVVVVGMTDAIVVDTPDAVLVCAADAAQDVKQVVDRLAAEGRRELL